MSDDRILHPSQKIIHRGNIGESDHLELVRIVIERCIDLIFQGLEFDVEGGLFFLESVDLFLQLNILNFGLLDDPAKREDPK